MTDVHFFWNRFTLDAMVKIKSSPRGLALLSYLRFLPGFSLDHAKISCVIKLLISKADPDDVIHHVIPIVESFGREVKQLSVPVLQKVVNRCQQLLGSKTMIMTEEKIHTIKAFLFNLNKLEVPGLTIPHFPALNVLRTDQLPSEISQLMREKRWDELVALYYRNVVLENTFANMKLVSALFEGNYYKIGVINYPLGQTDSLTSSEHCFHLKFDLLILKSVDGRTNGQNV